jgi:hypothetical protein
MHERAALEIRNRRRHLPGEIMTAWLGVVSRVHVLRAVSLGIAQLNHGRRPPLARLNRGDTIVYYSPRTEYPDGEPLKAFTAFGTIVDDEIWQADEGEFTPWRRRVDYASVHEAPIGPLTARLDLTRTPNWGYALRRGTLPLSDHDAELLRATMTG